MLLLGPTVRDNRGCLFSAGVTSGEMACPLIPRRIESKEDDAPGDVTAATSLLVFSHLIGRRGERLSAGEPMRGTGGPLTKWEKSYANSQCCRLEVSGATEGPSEKASYDPILTGFLRLPDIRLKRTSTRQTYTAYDRNRLSGTVRFSLAYVKVRFVR
jgi:hypothetical protein